MQKKEAIDLPTNFEFLTPLAREMALAQSSSPGRVIHECPGHRAQTDIPRALKGSVRSVASGVKFYLRFCDTMGAPEFPAIQETVRRWSATFNPGKTYGLYINHIKKADLTQGNEPM